MLFRSHTRSASGRAAEEGIEQLTNSPSLPPCAHPRSRSPRSQTTTLGATSAPARPTPAGDPAADVIRPGAAVVDALAPGFCFRRRRPRTAGADRGGARHAGGRRDLAGDGVGAAGSRVLFAPSRHLRPQRPLQRRRGRLRRCDSGDLRVPARCDQDEVPGARLAQASPWHSWR